MCRMLKERSQNWQKTMRLVADELPGDLDNLNPLAFLKPLTHYSVGRVVENSRLNKRSGFGSPEPASDEKKTSDLSPSRLNSPSILAASASPLKSASAEAAVVAAAELANANITSGKANRDAWYASMAESVPGMTNVLQAIDAYELTHSPDREKSATAIERERRQHALKELKVEKDKSKETQVNAANRGEGVGVHDGAGKAANTTASLAHKNSQKDIELRFRLLQGVQHQLNDLAAANVLRGVPSENLVYYPSLRKGTKPRAPFQLETTLLLKYASAMARLPLNFGKWKYFKCPTNGPLKLQRFLTQGASEAVFRDIFWYCFVKRYQRKNPRTLRGLAKSVGRNYSKLVANVQTKNHSLKDFCFTMLPFCMSFAVCAGFHYLLPSTRNIYSAPGWKTGIWLDVCGLISGIAWCSTTIDDLRAALFDENEKNQEESKPGDGVEAEKVEVSSSTPAQRGRRGSASRFGSSLSASVESSVLYEEKQTALDFEQLGMSGASRGVELRTIKKSEADVRERQPRLRFYASSPSPVCSLVISQQSEQAPASCVIRRSQTIENCGVGGRSTHVAYNVNEAVSSISGLMRRSRAQRQEFERMRVENRDRVTRELREIDRSTSMILSEEGAGADRQRFCADLPSIRQREREEIELREKKLMQDKKIREAVREREEEERKKRRALGNSQDNDSTSSTQELQKKDAGTSKVGIMVKKKEARIKAKEQFNARARRREKLVVRKQELADKLEKRRRLVEEKGGDMEAVLRAEAEVNQPEEMPLEPDAIFRQLKLFYV